MNFRKLAEKYRDSYFKDLNTLVEIESTKDEAKADPAAGMPLVRTSQSSRYISRNGRSRWV